MEFDLSSEQVMLQESLHRFLADAGGLERTRAFAAKGETRASDLILGLAQLGITGLLIAEEFGGSGLSLGRARGRRSRGHGCRFPSTRPARRTRGGGGPAAADWRMRCWIC